MNNSFSVISVSGVDITAKFAGFKWGYNRKKGAAGPAAPLQKFIEE